MPYQSRPSDRVVELVKAAGGNIWTSCTDTVAGGAAVARAAINAVFPVPDKAKTLLGWRPIETATAGAVAESMLSVFDIQGANFNFQPQEVMCGNTAGSILATGTPLQGPSEYYDVFAPVAGGETWNVGVEPLDALAGNRRSAAEFTWTDVRLPLPTVRSLCGREVAIAIAAVGEVPGVAMAITGAHELIEAGGCATESVNTAAEELMVEMILRCTALPINEIRFPFEPYAGSAITPSSNIAYVTRRLQRMKFSQPSVTVTSAYDVDVALAAAGQAAHYIRWI
jgi:hypothetical protein